MGDNEDDDANEEGKKPKNSHVQRKDVELKKYGKGTRQHIVNQLNIASSMSKAKEQEPAVGAVVLMNDTDIEHKLPDVIENERNDTQLCAENIHEDRVIVDLKKAERRAAEERRKIFEEE